MENLFEQLEEIMKPYYDIQEEIKNVKVIRDTEEKKVYDDAQSKKFDKQVELNILRAKLTKLTDNKESEINKYIEQIYITNPNASQTYISRIKEELQQEYYKQEKSLMDQINSIKKEIEAMEQPMLEDLVKVYEKPDFTRVYQKELLEVNDELRKQLIQKRNEIELELRQEKLNFDSVMLELSRFKYEYDENRNVINGADWKAIYEKSNVITDRINDLRKALNKIEENLKLVAPTGITDIPLSSLTPAEIAEYERRKALRENVIKEEQVETLGEPKVEDVVEKTEEGYKNIYTKNPESLIDSYTPVEASYQAREDETVVKSYEDLLKMVYNDVIAEAENLRSIKLDPIEGDTEFANTNYYFSEKQNKDDKYAYRGNVDLAKDRDVRLPNGEYINESDFYRALKDYADKNKGRTFKVKKRFLNQEYKIDEEAVRTIKNKFKECSTVKLLTDKKISDIDLRRVCGKEKSEEYKSKAANLGSIETKLPKGDYVSRNEMIVKLSDVFVKQNKKWYRAFIEKLKEIKNDYFSENVNSEETVYDVEVQKTK